MRTKHLGIDDPTTFEGSHASAPSTLRMTIIQAFVARRGYAQVYEVPPRGSAAAVLAAYREGLGVPLIPPPARSTRFKRLRGGLVSEGAPNAPNLPPLA